MGYFCHYPVFLTKAGIYSASLSTRGPNKHNPLSKSSQILSLLNFGPVLLIVIDSDSELDWGSDELNIYLEMLHKASKPNTRLHVKSGK